MHDSEGDGVIDNARIIDHLGIAYAAAMKWMKRTGIWWLRDDAIQSSCEGLVRAARDYDADLGVWPVYAYKRCVFSVLQMHRDNRFMSGPRGHPEERLPLVSTGEEDDPGIDVATERTPSDDWAIQELHDLVDSLPPRESRLVRETYLDGRQLQEVSRDLGIRLETGSRLRKHGLAILRECYAETLHTASA